MTNPDHIQRAWKEIPSNPVLPDLASLNTYANRLYRSRRRGRAIGFGACAVAAVCFTTFALVLRSPTPRVGAAMLLAGIVVVAWQIQRRISSARPPEHAAEPILVFQRTLLVRQREAATGVFYWCMLPLIPGILVMTLGGAPEQGISSRLQLVQSGGAALAFSVAVFGGVWLAVRRSARRLQKHIDAIDRLIAVKA